MDTLVPNLSTFASQMPRRTLVAASYLLKITLRVNVASDFELSIQIIFCLYLKIYIAQINTVSGIDLSGCASASGYAISLEELAPTSRSLNV